MLISMEFSVADNYRQTYLSSAKQAGNVYH